MVRPFVHSWILFSLMLASGGACLDAKKSNPLDGDIPPLFVPRVKSPSGGEHLFPGTRHEIRWQPATRVIDPVVTLQLASDADTVTIARDVRNSGLYFWDVPNRPALSYRIRIVGQGGVGESPGTFRIKPLPVTKPLDVGPEGGWAPSAFYDKVVFESNRTGNTDLWLLDRKTGDLSRLTTNPGFDGEAAWFKPGGKVMTYTTADSGGQKDVWIMIPAGRRAGQRFRITTTGGDHPAWQQTESLDKLALAYIRPASPSSPSRQIFAMTLNTAINVLPIIASPLTFATPPTALTPQSSNSQDVMKSIAWCFVDGRNAFFYTTGSRSVARVDFAFQNYENVLIESYALPIEFKPDRISVSPSGRWIAFSSDGDLWAASLKGLGPTPLTFGPEQDEAPDWASDSEIVFQRRNAGVWELRTLQVNDPP
jgi:hypothetical protein